MQGTSLKEVCHGKCARVEEGQTPRSCAASASLIQKTVF